MDSRKRWSRLSRLATSFSSSMLLASSWEVMKDWDGFTGEMMAPWAHEQPFLHHGFALFPTPAHLPYSLPYVVLVKTSLFPSLGSPNPGENPRLAEQVQGHTVWPQSWAGPSHSADCTLPFSGLVTGGL